MKTIKKILETIEIKKTEKWLWKWLKKENYEIEIKY